MSVQQTEGTLGAAMRQAGVVPARERLDQMAREAWRQHPYETGAGKRRQFIGAYLRGELTWSLVEEWRPSDLGAAVGWLLDLHKPREKPKLVSSSDAPAPQSAEVTRFPGRADRARATQAVLAKTMVKLSKLDTFTVNGMPVGDCTPEEAEGWASARECDARFIRMLIQPCPPGRPIRESWDGDDVDKLYERERR